MKSPAPMGGKWMWLLLAFASYPNWAFSQLGVPKGMVIYQPANSATPLIEEYASYETFSSVINLKGPSGKEFRVYHGQNPVFLPYATDSTIDCANALRQIQEAKVKLPKLATRLEKVADGWRVRLSSERAHAELRTKAANPSTNSPATSLHLKSGITYSDWRITRLEGDFVAILHADGLSSVKINDLPANVVRSEPVFRPMLKVAEERERGADFVAARELYGQLGLSEDVARVKVRAGQQEDEAKKRRTIAYPREDTGSIGNGVLEAKSGQAAKMDAQRIGEELEFLNSSAMPLLKRTLSSRTWKATVRAVSDLEPLPPDWTAEARSIESRYAQLFADGGEVTTPIGDTLAVIQLLAYSNAASAWKGGDGPSARRFVTNVLAQLPRGVAGNGATIRKTLTSVADVLQAAEESALPHRQKGEELARLGKRAEAARELESAYAIFPDPRLAELVKDVRAKSLGL